MYRSIFSTLALAATAFAAIISIDVGEGGKLAFNPNSMTAAVGDTLEFHFFSGSGGHSVVSGAFGSPCQPATNAIFSGYIPGNDSGNMTFVTTVNSTDPIWFYCSLDGHCPAGMVGVVNPPAGQTISDYMSAAQMASQVSAPAALQGGMLTTMSAGAMTSSMSMSSSMSSGMSSSMSMTSTMASTTTGSTSGSAASSSASVSSSKASSAASTAATATTTPSAAGRSNEMSTVLGLAVVVGGLVALMA